MAHASKARSLYRQLLRELPLPPTTTAVSKTRPSILSHATPLKSRIRSSFASPPSQSVETRLEEAEQYIQYLQAQRRYATLIERYNPGMNMDEEERVRLSARRVGMEMPAEFEAKPFGTSDGGEKAC